MSQKRKENELLIAMYLMFPFAYITMGIPIAIIAEEISGILMASFAISLWLTSPIIIYIWHLVGIKVKVIMDE